MNEPMWTQEQAIELCRQLQDLAIHFNINVALTGGVLYTNSSDKDIDVILYRHKTTKLMMLEEYKQLLFKQLRISDDWRECDHSEYGDEKEVYKTFFNGKRIDFFIL